LAEENGTKSIELWLRKNCPTNFQPEILQFMQSLQQKTLGNADMYTCIRFRKTLRKRLEKETK
jgi:hypothetical protein